ncbi:MAG: putative glycoside hydrolase [Patescibacteria group bacterium]|jgi:hypothetical protein
MNWRLLTAGLAKRVRVGWKNFSEAASPLAARYGLLAVIVFALPLLVFFSRQAAIEARRPIFFSDRPDFAAVSARSLPSEPGEDRRPIPAVVKGVYVSADTVGEKRRFNEIIKLVGETEINALVIDLKNYRSELAFTAERPELRPFVAPQTPLGRLPELTERLHEEGIYLIGRVPVFQDQTFSTRHPEYAVKKAGGGVWRDHRGLAWLDPASKAVWKYAVAIAEEAAAAGFDEIQFDYIRFPSDGDLSTIVYDVYDGRTPKAEVMRGFFRYLDHELRLKHNIRISVDLFGLVMWQHQTDMNIGQRLDAALPSFDYISPMVYPSHYPAGFNGYANPALYPYEVVYKNLVRGQEVPKKILADAAADAGAEVPKLATIRPWIQDFNMGAVYDAAKVRAQIKASMDGGASGWLLWNAANVYTAGALEKGS